MIPASNMPLLNLTLSVLASAQSGITLNTYNMLTRVKTWPAFSNHTKGDDGSASNSLESIHDAIHDAIGGHMSDPSVSGKCSHAQLPSFLYSYFHCQGSIPSFLCTMPTLIDCYLCGPL